MVSADDKRKLAPERLAGVTPRAQRTMVVMQPIGIPIAVQNGKRSAGSAFGHLANGELGILHREGDREELHQNNRDAFGRS